MIIFVIALFFCPYRHREHVIWSAMHALYNIAFPFEISLWVIPNFRASTLKLTSYVRMFSCSLCFDYFFPLMYLLVQSQTFLNIIKLVLKKNIINIQKKIRYGNYF